jgi:hypothetical protein
LVPALVLAACSTPTSERSVAARPDRDPAPYVKVVLTRDAATGRVEVDSATAVESVGERVAGAYQYFVVAYAGDEVRSATTLSFPEFGTREWIDGDGRPVRSDTIPISTATSAALTPYSRELTRIDVIDRNGEVVATIDASDVRSAVARPPSWLVREALASNIVATIQHIQIEADLAALPSEYWSEELASEDNPLVQGLEAPGDDLIGPLTVALNRLPPVLFGVISRISIANYENEGTTCDAAGNCSQVGGDTYGNNLLLNAALFDDQVQLNQTVAHEAVHCFHEYLKTTGAVNFDNLPPGVEQAADEARGRLLNTNISAVLARLQSTAMIADDIYRDYAGDAWNTTYTGASPVTDGFVAAYASKNPREDLAELAALFVGDDFADHAYCSQFDGLDKEIPSHNVLAFAKLNFVRALGLIEEGQYAACVRNADPADAELISMGSREFSGDLEEGFQQVSHEDLNYDWIMWRIKGLADDAQLEIRVRTQKADGSRVRSPVGFYQLDDAGSLGMGSEVRIPLAAQNVILFQRTDTSNDTELAAYTRTSGGGFLLITDYSNAVKKGYAFMVPMYGIIELQPPPSDVFDVVWFLMEE